MDRKGLESYRELLKKKERLEKGIEENTAKLSNLPAVPAKTKGSSADFPYTEQKITIEGDCKKAKKIKDVLFVNKFRLEEVVREIARKRKEVESFIDNIPCDTLRQIFYDVYILDMTQEEVARWSKYERSSISKKITGYFENIHTIHKKNML